MTRMQLLTGRIRNRNFLAEREIARYDIDSLYSEERAYRTGRQPVPRDSDFLQRRTMATNLVRTRKRKALRKAISEMLPKADIGVYQTELTALVRAYSQPNTDLTPGNLAALAQAGYASFYYRDGRYFTRWDGNGFDVTDFLKVNLAYIFGVRGARVYDYDKYLIKFRDQVEAKK